jgi:hypothetical protein
MNLESIAQGILLYFVLPIWVVTGAADALCHKITHIERTTGLVESFIHLAMLAEVGAGVLAALFLELTGAILVFLVALWVLHEVTSYLDLHYASHRRFVPPWEQRVHDYLAVLPLLALVLVALLSWGQVLAVFGLGPQSMDYGIRLKEHPLSPIYLSLLLSAIFLFNVLPYVLELARCLRGSGQGEET